MLWWRLHHTVIVGGLGPAGVQPATLLPHGLYSTEQHVGSVSLLQVPRTGCYMGAPCRMALVPPFCH